MAKGNLFQGMARGKVGDVVFSRLNGEQISRVRNRAPKNPRSNAQMIQRAIMATIMQAYSAGREIFDHSFEGKSVGAENQREFMSLNARKLRALLAADFNAATTTQAALARVVAPGAYVPVPNSYIISRGSYNQNLFTIVEGLANVAAATEGETVSAYAARTNIVPGDIFTIVVFGASATETAYSSALGDLASTPACVFSFARLIVKDDILTNETAMENLGQIFTLEKSNPAAPLNLDLVTDGDGIGITSVAGAAYTEGAIGVIRSRLDVDLRSNSDMVFTSKFGIIAPYILDAWKNAGETLGDSDLILEGGNF